MFTAPAQQSRSLFAMLFVMLFSGVPLPILDAHAIDPASIADNPLLQKHLSSTPVGSHQNVSDSELHIHWISPIVVSENLQSHPETLVPLDEQLDKTLISVRHIRYLSGFGHGSGLDLMGLSDLSFSSLNGAIDWSVSPLLCIDDGFGFSYHPISSSSRRLPAVRPMRI